MPLYNDEAFVLRTYALKESDRIVSFFTRTGGKRRGVARGARRPKSKFGAALEPLTQVRIQYFEREGRELGNIDHCELIASPLASGVPDLLNSVAASVMVEVAERLLPDHEVNDAVFRLLAAASAHLRASQGEAAWLALTYYLFWMVRLGGFLPELDLSPEAQVLAQAMARQPLSALEPAAAGGAAGRELRQKLKRCLEDHIESGLKSWTMLVSLEGT